MMHNRRTFVRLAIVTVAGGLAASAGVVGASTAPPSSEPAAPTTEVVVPTTEAVASTAVPAPAVTYPLTGLPVADASAYTPRPALIVKIDNGVNSQPQSGLNEADIVFEEIVEGTTRFAAVFNSTDSDPVGNIRSGRTQDVELFGSYNDPIFAFSGGNGGVVGALQSTGWTLLTQGDGMFRVDGRGGAPYNLFGNTSDMFSRAGESGEAVAQFQYGTEAGTPVTSVDLEIGGRSVNWAWNAEQGLFLRSQQGDAHDTSTGQFSTNNVVVLLVPYGASSADTGSPEAQTVGTGDAIVYAGGLKTVGTWTRDDASQPFTLTDAGGNPILLRPGRTMVELGEAGSTTFTDDAAV